MEVTETLLQTLIQKLDRLETYITDHDAIEQLAEIKRELKAVRADTRITSATVQDHGNRIAALKKTIEALRIRCPLLKLETDELSKIP